MKSIRAKIMLCMSITVLISLLVTNSVCIFLNYRSTQDTLEQTMLETAELAAERVEQELNTYRQIAAEVGSMSRLSNVAVSFASKETLMEEKIETHGFRSGNLITATGNGLFDNVDYSDQDFFQKAMQGETVISTPTVDEATGELVILIAAPLWQSGLANTKVVGVVYFQPQPTFLNDIVSSIQISPGGSAYMLDAQGYTIAHQNMQNVLNRENTQQDAQNDASLKNLASLEQRMVKGERGFSTYTYDGVKKFLAFAPVGGTDGWSIAINAPTSDFLSSTTSSAFISLIIAVVALIVSLVFARWLANNIGKPLTECAARLQTMAEGDLHSPTPEVTSRDEIGTLLTASSTLQTDLNDIIQDLRQMMNQLATGNFLADSENAALYKGDYVELLQASHSLRDTMDSTLEQISSAAEQVDAGGEQVSSTAQSLSQGATEQAASVEELAATINDITHHIEQSSQYAENASGKAAEAGRLTNECNGQMKEMVLAMNDISSTSQEISKIIKAIEDISFQTNILALNAAVEAARAGAAGKGFAVVADEVRNLAGKAAEASKNTSVLIEASMTAVNRGSKLVDATAERLETVSESANTMVEMIQQIASAAQHQAVAAQQISTGIDQISAVVQTNSATAEESAAASQELSGQAQLLKQLVGQFVLSSSEPAFQPAVIPPQSADEADNFVPTVAADAGSPVNGKY